MAIREIVQEGAPVLRKTAPPVTPEEIGSNVLNTLIADMRETLANCSDGVGLAAPQVGVSKRLFIVSQRIFLEEGQGHDEEKNPGLVFINPTIEKLSKTRSLLEEGCLSVRGKYGYIERADKARVRALNEDGKPFTYSASGLLAEIFQHEVDHLNGTLYVDKASGLHDVTPPTHE